jgi:oligosaccharide repeat unit polymerase
MTLIWFCSLLPVSVIASLAIVARLLSRSWTHPATLFPSIWAAHALMPLLLAPDLPLYPSGLWWIAMACFSVQTGAFLSAPPTRKQSSDLAAAKLRERLRHAALRPMVTTALCLLPVAILSGYLTIDAANRSLASLTSIQGLARMASASSVFRYMAKFYRPNLAVQFFSSAIYLAPVLGGVIYALRRNCKHSLIAFSTFSPALFVTATQTTKAAVLLAAVYWIAGYLACTEYTGGRPSGKKVIALLALACLLTGGLIGTAESLRSGSVPTLPRVLAALNTDRTRTMVFGHMFVFTQWFDESFQAPLEPTYGAFTFAGPADLMGLSTRVAGLFSDSKYITSLTSTSNIYTYFRGLLQDFTMPGALLFLFAGGVFGGWAYRGAREFRIARMPWLMLYIASALWYFGSVFTYNSLIVAFVAFVACWRMATRPLRTEPRCASRRVPCPAYL